MSEWLQCIGCERRFDAAEVRYTCECGELLSVERDAVLAQASDARPPDHQDQKPGRKQWPGQAQRHRRAR